MHFGLDGVFGIKTLGSKSSQYVLCPFPFPAPKRKAENSMFSIGAAEDIIVLSHSILLLLISHPPIKPLSASIFPLK
jgi:hypothetical protein